MDNAVTRCSGVLNSCNAAEAEAEEREEEEREEEEGKEEEEEGQGRGSAEKRSAQHSIQAARQLHRLQGQQEERCQIEARYQLQERCQQS